MQLSIAILVVLMVVSPLVHCVSFPSGGPMLLKHTQQKSGFQSISSYGGGSTGTTQFLILANSHGNPQHGRWTKKATMQGGDWQKVGDAGNDDKSIEVWKRSVTSGNKNSVGKINTKGGAGLLSIITFQGNVRTGNIGKKTLPNGKDAPFSVSNSGSGPFLVIACSDNSGWSRNAKLVYDKKGVRKNVGDDPVFVYWTNDASFRDSASGKRRGAVISIQMSGGSSSPSPPTRPSPSPSRESCGWSSSRGRYTYPCEGTCSGKCRTANKGRRKCGPCGANSRAEEIELTQEEVAQQEFEATRQVSTRSETLAAAGVALGVVALTISMLFLAIMLFKK